MEFSSQTENVIEPIHTKKHLRKVFHNRDKSLNAVLELPSIRRKHNFFHHSNVSESPRLRTENMVSPTRFPSIFKKYQQAIDT